jgi:hypothetical protein
MRPSEPIAGSTIAFTNCTSEQSARSISDQGGGAATEAPLPRQVGPCYHSVALSGHSVGAWRSLVARIVRDDEVGGSNPLAPTISTKRSSRV